MIYKANSLIKIRTKSDIQSRKKNRLNVSTSDIFCTSSISFALLTITMVVLKVLELKNVGGILSKCSNLINIALFIGVIGLFISYMVMDGIDDMFCQDKNYIGFGRTSESVEVSNNSIRYKYKSNDFDDAILNRNNEEVIEIDKIKSIKYNTEYHHVDFITEDGDKMRIWDYIESFQSLLDEISNRSNIKVEVV